MKRWLLATSIAAGLGPAALGCCPHTACGNGVVEPTETCDDGGAESGDGCGEACAIEDGFSCSGAPSVCALDAFCGDGLCDAGEGCVSCPGDCGPCPACGDGVLDAGEDCDDAAESASCDGDCTVVECSDGTLNATAGEECDDGNLTDGDGCSPECASAPASCGDAICDLAGEDTCASCPDDCSSDPICLFGPSDLYADFNGDGWADIVAGAPGNGGTGLPGSAYVYLGGPGATFDAAADGMLTGASVNDLFGRSVAVAGDVNGDRYADVVVGAFLDDAAYVYLGGPGLAFDPTPDAVVYGSPGEGFGFSVASAGDVNGDGCDDVVVGALYSITAGPSAGAAYVYLGGPGSTFDATPDGTLLGAAANDEFGRSVASAGDVNGDDYADVVVGATPSAAGTSSPGSAYVFLGGPGVTFDPTADGILTGAAATDYFGARVASAGDVNADGYTEVVVGAPYNDAAGVDAGAAYVYLGGPGGTFDSTPDATLLGATADDRFGSAVSSAGDVNGDGHADIIIGAYLSDAGGFAAGSAYVYLGGPGATIDATPDGVLDGAAGGEFGLSVAGAGDVNGDGYGDVVVGGYAIDAVGYATGIARVYLGGAGGAFDATPDATLLGSFSGDLFGRSVASAGEGSRDRSHDVFPVASPPWRRRRIRLEAAAHEPGRG